MTKEQEQMTEKYIYLVWTALKQFRMLNKIAVEKYFDVGIIGLCKGVNKFKKELGYQPETLLMLCIKKEIMWCMRDERRLKRNNGIPDLSLEELNPKTNGLSLLETLSSNIDTLEIILELEKKKYELEILKLIYKEIDKLNLRDKEILYSYYGINGYQKKDTSELAKEYNYKDYKSVNSRISTLRSKIKKQIQSEKIWIDYNCV